MKNNQNFDEEPPEEFEDFPLEELERLCEIYGDHEADNEKKPELPITWDLHKSFSAEFLAQYHDLVLCDIFHHIKACLLFPPNCPCKKSCQCPQLREKIILTLNTNQYTEAERFETPDRLAAMKDLCHMPEDHAFRALHAQAYPLWIIEKEWQNKEENNHFKMIDQLVWALLQLGKTSKACFLPPDVSLKEAIETILGDTPVGAKVIKLKKAAHFGGEKKYDALFKHYQSVCHFIAALEFCKRETPLWESLFMSSPYPPLEFVEKFLKVAHWFRKNLLLLERPNFKNKVFLREKDLCPLPVWVQSDAINLPIKPFQEKVKKILSNALRVDPVTKTTTKVDLYSEYFKASPGEGGELDDGETE